MAFCPDLQRGDGPVTSGRPRRQRAFGGADAVGHPAVLHRVQTTGPAQHEVETTTGSRSPPRFGADRGFPTHISSLLSLGLEETLFVSQRLSLSLFLSCCMHADFSETESCPSACVPVLLKRGPSAHFRALSLSAHQWTIFSHNTSHVLDSPRTAVSRFDPLVGPRVVLRVEHVSARGGKLWSRDFGKEREMGREVMTCLIKTGHGSSVSICLPFHRVSLKHWLSFSVFFYVIVSTSPVQGDAKVLLPRRCMSGLSWPGMSVVLSGRRVECRSNNHMTSYWRTHDSQRCPCQGNFYRQGCSCMLSCSIIGDGCGQLC